MSTVHPVALTLRRKRAASGADPKPYDFPTTPKTFSEYEGIPGSSDIPELVWDESPESTKCSPRTPSKDGSPQAQSTDKEIPRTPTRLCKELRRSVRIEEQRSSKLQLVPVQPRPSKLEPSHCKPTLVFPLYLYPALSALETEEAGLSDIPNGDISESNFNFFELSRRSYGYNTSSTPVLRCSRSELPCTLPKQRALVPKRMRHEKSSNDEIAKFDRNNVPDSEAVGQKSSATERGTKFTWEEATIRRFTRILPLTTIERVIELPRTCVASLVSDPGRRCLQLTMCYQDAKVWVLDYLSKCVVPKDLTAAESYLRELVNMVTCTEYHRSIAIKQLNGLFSHFGESHRKKTGGIYGYHAFTAEDGEAIPHWLEALTTLPESQKSVSQFSIQRIDACFKSVDPVPATMRQSSAVTVSQKIPHVTEVHQQLVQAFGDVQRIDNVTNTQTIQTTEITRVTCGSAGSNPTSETKETTEVIQSIAVAHLEQTARTEQKTCSIATASAPQPSTASQTISDINQPFEAVISLKTKTEIRTSQPVASLSSFDATQTVTVSFAATPSRWTMISDSDRRKQAEAGKEKYIQTVNQRFERYRPVESLQYSIEDWIRECLVRPFPGKEQSKKHQGIIYMYWVTGNFGLVKIGKTSGASTAKRLEQWREQCGHRLEEHTRGEQGVAVQLPYALQVEALVHAELSEFRVREPACQKCLKSHIEWFAISPDHAQKVIQKWSDWMATIPYEVCGREWRLRKEVSADYIDALCKPIKISIKDQKSLPTPRRLSQPEKMTKRVKGRKKVDVGL